MDYCTHSLTQPVLRITSCKFEHDPPVQIIETGGRADVLCGILGIIRKKVAVKAFRRIDRNLEDLVIENEIKIWRLLGNHPHIASFIGIAPVNDYHPKYLAEGAVSDYCAHGDLKTYLYKSDEDVVNHQTRFELLLGVIQGLAYIHEQSVVHGDLKAHNILVDGDGKVARICDFGSSSIECGCYSGPHEQEGTVPWDSPELWMEEDEPLRTHQSDIWAYGCVALEVQMGLMPWDPFNERNGRAMKFRQYEAQTGPPAKVSDPNLNLGMHPIKQRVWDLMVRCWSADPQQRPSAAELLAEMLSISPVSV
ncbi:hypothetical protein OPQ81_003703 [Rhizoctonia solani]|nr:hypothetical protein OPQ81_003703 [Rhizoctonia solani]